MLKILNPLTATKGFQELKSKRNWILALLVVFIPGILSVVGQALVEQKSQVLTLQFVEEMGVNEAQMQSIRSIQGLLTWITIVTGIVMILIFWVLKSAVFHFLSGAMGGEKVEFSSTCHMVAYTYVPFFFKGIIDLVKGITYTPPPYEQYVSGLLHPDVLLTFVRGHNLFLIWALGLMIVAVRTQYNLSTKKALLVVMVPYIVAWIGEIALTMIGPQMGGLGGV